MSQRKYKNWLQEHKNRIFSYAFYFLRNREDAEDVTQEVFIRLWNHMENINHKKIVAWLMQVAHNCCVDHARKRKGIQNTEKIMETMDRIPDQNGLDSNPERLLEDHENKEVLLSAMDALPDRTRSMLLLHYYQGLKYETIGSIFEMDAGAVKVAVHRGRKVLREKLTPHFSQTLENCSNE